RNPWPLRIAAGLAVVVLVSAFLYWQFRFYSEQKQVERFLDALVAGDYPGAYRIWGPTADYTFQDFLQDWGETTPRGRIRSYEIVSVAEPPREVAVSGGPTLRMGGNSSGVVVTVRLNGTTDEVKIWVERKNKTLSFAPF
ncbi:MAG: hypothetical protein ACRD4D_09970, partial [Candidatus Acidiferrales bacterium]